MGEYGGQIKGSSEREKEESKMVGRGKNVR